MGMPRRSLRFSDKDREECVLLLAAHEVGVRNSIIVSASARRTYTSAEQWQLPLGMMMAK